MSGTKFNIPIATLHDNGKLILKAYVSPDGSKIRIVLPEFVQGHQVIGNIEGPVKYIEFARKP